MRVAIIDDHQIFREGLVALLEPNDDLEIIGQAGDGKAGLKLILDETPAVAIVDINLPEMTGLEILKAVRHQNVPTKVVLLTSDRKPSDAAKAIALGVEGYVLKDDAFEDLEGAIRAARLGRQFVSPGIAALIVSHQQETINEVKRLSAREREVLSFIAEGLTNKEVAEQLGVSVNTVRTHRARLMDKLDLHTTGELVRYAVDRGLT